jgi:Mg-chelatase subunit ChlD
MRKKLIILSCIIACSCGIIRKPVPPSSNNKGKGSPIHIVNGKKAEKVVEKDAQPPSGYYSCKALQEVKAKDSKKLDLNSIILESFDARISANEGSISYTFYEPYTNTYFTEINKNAIQGIKIIKDSLTCKVLNYKLTQTIDAKRAPQSIVFIMDHSGSMGDNRANILQAAVDSAVNYKHPNDEITIIKFDDKVNRLVTSKNLNDIQSALRPLSGLTGYGYTTAIQDAIKMAIEEQTKSSNKEKMIVLLTDGCENSSIVAPDLIQLLSEAKRQKIIINAFGFGQYIDSQYLNFISQETGGYFKQLFSRDEISHVFNHTMYRINNNIKISFSPCMFGDSLTLVTTIKLNDSIYTNKRLIFSPFSLGEKIELNVLFDKEKYNIKKEYEDEINSFVKFLKDYSNVTVEIAGHTDSNGEEKDNIKLSQNRAVEIKKYLVSKGIDSKRISTVGYGESAPKYPNDSEENKTLNRRIEAKIIGN